MIRSQWLGLYVSRATRALAYGLLLGAAGASQAAPDLTAGKGLYETCASCHGVHGEGNPKLGAPNLTGQQPAYLSRQILAFIQGTRGAAAGDTYGAQMRAVTQVFQGEDDVDNVAAYLASLPLQRSSATATAAKTDARTGKSYFNGICSACHGSDGAGNIPLSAPRLAGQDAAYLVRQYAHFKNGARGSDKDDTYGLQMRSMVRGLPDTTTEAAVLAYVAALEPGH